MKYLDFSDYIRQDCQGVPNFMLERAVRDSAIEFCKKTGVYIPEEFGVRSEIDVFYYSDGPEVTTEIQTKPYVIR